MANLKDIAEMPGPTFTYSHNLPSHRSFLFDRDGNFHTESELKFVDITPNSAVLYIDQLMYVNNAVGDSVDFTLKRSTREPVIIIQGGHGPYQSSNSDFDNLDDHFINERTGILNAYYLPEPCRSSLYPSISPANSFRRVFGCLGVDLELLEDKTYWSIGGTPIDYSNIGR